MRLFSSVVVGGCLFGCWFCVFVCVVVLGPLLFVSNCLIPSSSHKSCGDFQVLVKGHWTYSWAYVWVCRVSHVSLTWTAGILEICCSLRGKKNKIPGCLLRFNPIVIPSLNACGFSVKSSITPPQLCFGGSCLSKSLSRLAPNLVLLCLHTI